MSEVIYSYKLTDLDQVIAMDRQEFYDEQIEVYKKTGKPSRAIEIVQVLLLTQDNFLILQKRSLDKRHNAGLIDKSLGGHMKFGDSSSYTVMVETLQELAVPSIVVPSKDEFVKTYKLLKEHLNHISIIQHVDTRTHTLTKSFDGEMISIANKYHFYLGVYGGSVRPADHEASGILFYDIHALQKEIEKTPEVFTDDLRFFLHRYEDKITEFISLL